jgi:hypothetical protein
MVQQENAALRQRIEDLESVSVRAPGSTSTSASAANTPLDQPSEYLVSHLIDPVINLTQGDFTANEAWWALFQSNNDLDATAEILLSCPPVSSARIRLDESQYRPPRGRGRDGSTPQLFRSSLSTNPIHHQQSVPLAAGSSVRDDQLASTLMAIFSST